MKDLAYRYMDWPRIEAVIYGEEASPRDVMGPRLTVDGVLFQGYFPGAREAFVLAEGTSHQMIMEDEKGYFAVLLPLHMIPAYQFRVKWKMKEQVFHDCYAFPDLITEEEEKAFLAGVWYRSFEKLGAHPTVIDGVSGISFAVWAPNAVRVSVVGDFNRWDGRRLLMHRKPMSGIFELFVPGLKPGTLYKYEIQKKGGERILKADPYAFEAEKPEGDASIVSDSVPFLWSDQKWISDRKKYDDRRQPVSIFETSLTDWKSTDALLRFVRDTGYSFVELHPVMEYLDEATDGYSTTSYFAPTKRFGTAQDLKQLIDTLHAEGVGVILDWTPAQFPKNEAGLSMFDGTALYEVPDPSMAVHPMWDTMLFNYESPIVSGFLISNALFWAEEYHADGLRFDDVDAMLYLDYGRKEGSFKGNIYGGNENLAAVEFLKHLNSIMKKRNPGVILIAQEDGLWPELTGPVEEDNPGFDYKWSGGFTADLLEYLSVDPVYRKNYHDELTLSMLYAYSEHYILTLGSRDVGSLASFRDRIWGSSEQKKAALREAYAYLYMHPGCKMTAPDPDAPEEIKKLLADLNKLYLSHPALYAKDHDYDGFEWIQLMKYEENVLCFLRKNEKEEETLLVLCNFAAIPYDSYQTGVPFYGKYKEIFNTDSTEYGGSGDVNPRAKTSLLRECDERDCSIKVKLPALSVVVFQCTPADPPAAKKAAGSAGKAGKKAAEKPGHPVKKSVRTSVGKAAEAAEKKVRDLAGKAAGAAEKKVRDLAEKLPHQKTD